MAKGLRWVHGRFAAIVAAGALGPVLCPASEDAKGRKRAICWGERDE
jgi:hypothetical protein